MKRGLGVVMFAIASIAFVSIKKSHRSQDESQNNKHIVYLDPILSTSAQQEISEFVLKHVQKNPKVQSDFIELLVSRFPYLSNVHARSFPHMQSLDIEVAAPVLSVNEHCILTDKGQIVAKKVYQESIVHDLYGISVAATMPYPILSENLLKTIAQVSSSFYDQYNIALINETECWLTDKTDNRFAILFNSFSIPDEKLVARCIAIKNEKKLQEELNQNHKKKSNTSFYVADIRFKDQIIISPYKKLDFLMEGAHHG